MAVVAPQWERQFQSISERVLETFPRKKTAFPVVFSLLESCNHFSSVILLDSSDDFDIGAGQLLSDHSVTHMDLVLLGKGFECQSS